MKERLKKLVDDYRAGKPAKDVFDELVGVVKDAYEEHPLGNKFRDALNVAKEKFDDVKNNISNKVDELKGDVSDDIDLINADDVTVVNITIDDNDSILDIIKKVADGVNKSISDKNSDSDASSVYKKCDFLSIINNLVNSISDAFTNTSEKDDEEFGDEVEEGEEIDDVNVAETPDETEYAKPSSGKVADATEYMRKDIDSPERGQSIADVLRNEMKEKFEVEENAKRLADYVYRTITDKENKNYRFIKDYLGRSVVAVDVLAGEYLDFDVLEFRDEARKLIISRTGIKRVDFIKNEYANSVYLFL